MASDLSDLLSLQNNLAVKNASDILLSISPVGVQCCQPDQVAKICQLSSSEGAEKKIDCLGGTKIKTCEKKIWWLIGNYLFGQMSVECISEMRDGV